MQKILYQALVSYYIPKPLKPEEGDFLFNDQKWGRLQGQIVSLQD